MTSLPLKQFTSVLFVVGAGACGGARPSTPPPPAPVEPAPGPTTTAPAAPAACAQELGSDAPDAVDSAPALQPGTTQGCYGVNDAKDTFTLTAPAHAGPVLYKLRVASPTGTACLVAHDAKRATLPKLNTCAKSPGAALEAWAVVMGGSTWSLETRDLGGNTLKTEEPYTLEVSAEPIMDPGEPDAQDKAVPLTLGEAKQAFLVNAANADKLDNDYFVVEIPKDMRKKTTLDVSIANVPADAQVAVRVLDAKGKVLGEGSGANAGAAFQKPVKMRGPGQYIIHVRNLDGSNLTLGGAGAPVARALEPYTITVSAP